MEKILGRTIDDWIDIYCLIKFSGKTPASLKDLYIWRAPEQPDECLKLAMELVRAREFFIEEAQQVRDWLSELLVKTPVLEVKP